MGKAKQWYIHVVRSMNGDWEELIDKFYLAFFPMSHIVSLPRAILDFEQYKKESIGAAWARFSMLIFDNLDLSLPDGVLLHLFCLGLHIDVDLCLGMMDGGHFTHKPMTKQVKFLENFLESYTSPIMRTRTL